jgi:hypothetical protein
MYVNAMLVSKRKARFPMGSIFRIFPPDGCERLQATCESTRMMSFVVRMRNVATNRIIIARYKGKI